MAAEDVRTGAPAAASNPDVLRTDEDSEFHSTGRPPNMVRLPSTKPLVPPSQLHVESEQSEHSDFLPWQVYAFGGYLVAKWLWGKWKERQNQKGNSDE